MLVCLPIRSSATTADGKDEQVQGERKIRDAGQPLWLTRSVTSCCAKCPCRRCDFTHRSLITRINSDLANDLGNLVHRTSAMTRKYFDGILPAAGPRDALDEEISAGTAALAEKYAESMDRMYVSQALGEIWGFVGRLNRYIDQTSPWTLNKNAADRERLGTVLYTLTEGLRVVAVLLKPFLIHAPGIIFDQFSIDEAYQTWESALSFGALPSGGRVKQAPALFPRLDVEEELAAFAPQQVPTDEPPKPEITFEDFQSSTCGSPPSSQRRTCQEATSCSN